MSVTLPERFQARVQSFPETHGGINTITVTLKDGRVYSGVEVAWASDVIRVAGGIAVPFTAEDIADVEDASGLA